MNTRVYLITRLATLRLKAIAREVEVTVRQQWGSLKPEERAQRLVDALNRQLKATGGFAVRQKFKEPGGRVLGTAVYDPRENRIAFDRAAFDKDTISRREVAGLVEAVAHEGEHAVQWYKVFRLLTAAGAHEKEIARILGITKPTVIRAAADHPLSSDSPTAHLARAQYFFKALVTNEEHHKTVEARSQLAAEKLIEARALQKMAQEDPKATSLFKEILGDRLKQAQAAFDKAYQAYRALPEEADAFRVGERAASIYTREFP